MTAEEAFFNTGMQDSQFQGSLLALDKQKCRPVTDISTGHYSLWQHLVCQKALCVQNMRRSKWRSPPTIHSATTQPRTRYLVIRLNNYQGSRNEHPYSVTSHIQGHKDQRWEAMLPS